VRCAEFGHPQTLILLIAATAAGSLTPTVVGKAVVGRTRPALADPVPPDELAASFTSGHTLNSVALAYLLIRRRRKRTRILTILTRACSRSRSA
jgi:membrane-associated phospholipid phosphatase